jgi:hypothetical protein
MREDDLADAANNGLQSRSQSTVSQPEPISFSPRPGTATATKSGHLAVSPDQLSASDLAVLFQGLLGTQDGQ